LIKKLYKEFSILNKNFSRHFLFITFILIITHFFNIYQNIYHILVRPYEERMILSYGYCERESYGFLRKAYQITHSQNLKVLNFEKHLWAPINGLFNVINKPEDKKYLVLLNLKYFNKDFYADYENQKILIKKENIIIQEGNCYLIKND
jgi:hypothetical protein